MPRLNASTSASSPADVGNGLSLPSAGTGEVYSISTCGEAARFGQPLQRERRQRYDGREVAVEGRVCQ